MRFLDWLKFLWGEHMSQRHPVFAYWLSSDGDWRWHLKATNGEIVAQGEGYATKAGVLRGIAGVRRNAAKAVLCQTTCMPAG